MTEGSDDRDWTPGERCPGCERPPIGGIMLTLQTPVDGYEVDAIVCAKCRTVWAPVGGVDQ